MSSHPSTASPSDVPAAPISPAEAERARAKYRRDKKNIHHFLRAARYLKPYRWLVGISVACALFVGLAMTSGLATMLPIIRILINGDTIPTWVDRAIVDHRLGAVLSDDPAVQKLILVRVDKHKPAYDYGYRAGDELVGDLPPRQLLHSLASDSVVLLHRPNHQDETFFFQPTWFFFRWAQSLASLLPANPVKAIGVVFSVLASMAILGNIGRFFQEYLSDKAAILAVNDIRRRLYDHTLRVPLGHFGEQGTSDVTSRLVQDSANLQDGLKQVVGQSIQEPINAIYAFAFAMVLSWKLTLFIICFAPVMFIIVKKFGKKMRRASRKALQESSTMLGQLEATMLGIRVVKAAGAERIERRRYTGIMRQLVNEQLRMSRIDAYSAPIMETLTLLVAGCVVMFAAYLVLVAKTLESDKFIGVMVALVTIGESLRRCSKVNNALQQTNAAAARIFEAMDLPVEQTRSTGGAAMERLTRPAGEGAAGGAGGVAASAGALTAGRLVKLKPLARKIEFENLTFTYPSSRTAALDNLSLTVPRGRSIAIVGRNGSGKTTLMALLPRFYDPQQGRITIDGIDIRQATLRSLRKQISVVTQDSVIFPGTIAENIAYGHPLASRLSTSRWPSVIELRAQIEEAAKRAFAHDFIMEKPQGYDTVLGELGGQLSGGQKQRLCIARAMLRRTPILILDEATSQVDAESEHLIQQAIERLMREGAEHDGLPARTMFVIAHRFSTIKSADTIVVMERGRIVGQGTHDDLLVQCPTYQQLYERQLVGAGGISSPSPASSAL